MATQYRKWTQEHEEHGSSWGFSMEAPCRGRALLHGSNLSGETQRPCWLLRTCGLALQVVDHTTHDFSKEDGVVFLIEDSWSSCEGQPEIAAWRVRTGWMDAMVREGEKKREIFQMNTNWVPRTVVTVWALMFYSAKSQSMVRPRSANNQRSQSRSKAATLTFSSFSWPGLKRLTKGGHWPNFIPLGDVDFLAHWVPFLDRLSARTAPSRGRPLSTSG